MNRRQQARLITNLAFALVSQGLEAERQGQFEVARHYFEKALEPLKKAIETDPTYEHAYNERAFVLARLQRFDEAAESARNAISLAPHVPKFRMALIGIGLDEVGLQKSRQSRKRSGETYYSAIEDITRLFPGYPSGFLAQATLRAMTGAGQSLWEASLSEAAGAYFKMKVMSSGEDASEAEIAKAMKGNIMKCLELAREWDRLNS